MVKPRAGPASQGMGCAPGSRPPAGMELGDQVEGRAEAAMGAVGQAELFALVEGWGCRAGWSSGTAATGLGGTKPLRPHPGACGFRFQPTQFGQAPAGSAAG